MCGLFDALVGELAHGQDVQGQALVVEAVAARNKLARRGMLLLP